jgi:type IV pilus assembly protein PilX
MRTRIPVRISSRRANSGAALVIGLILLLVMTLLAISGMNTSTTELQMAANMQYGEKAFQAAEVGIERAFRSGSYSTTGGAVPLNGTVATGQPETYTTSTAFDVNAGVTPVLTGGYSVGIGAGYSAYHFNIDSTGTSSRNATATNTQSFFVVGPSSR